MKKILLLVTATVGSFLLKPSSATAQVSVNINIGSQPLWGPVGYDYAEYYYLPDIECYYNVPRQQFVYLDAGRWIFAAGLPRHCSGYDLFSGYKVVINGPNPFMQFNDHRRRYIPYRSYGPQIVIRDSRDPRYYRNYGHPYARMDNRNNWGRDNRNNNDYRSRDNDRRDDRYSDNNRRNDRYNDNNRGNDRYSDRGRDNRGGGADRRDGNDRGRDNGRGNDNGRGRRN